MWRKWNVIAAVGLTILLALSACGSTDETKETNDANQEAAKTETTTATNETSEELQPQEPTSEDTCAFCNMKVYEHDHDMGAHTGQMVTADGEHLFFDDIGCLLNHARTMDQEPQAMWVRDYETKEWFDADAAIPVKADIKTPMKFGTALFETEEQAKLWMESHTDLNGTLTTMEKIDEEAEARYKKKMEMMKKEQNDQDSNE